MEYLIVAFRSRSHTIKFYEFLKSNGIYSEIVNTPKEAGVGCGLSVKTNKSQLNSMKMAVRAVALNSFAGFFLVSFIGDKRMVRSI